jgi:flagellar biogenesis protein FliO/flagellar motor switch/type III secretory pathway protein FliN
VNFWTVISSVLAMLLALGFVLLLAWGTIFLLKKWQDKQMGAVETDGTDWTIRFVRSMPLGQRERVALIEVRGETLLLGITAGSMSVLQRWVDAPEASAIEAAYQKAEAGLEHLPPKPQSVKAAEAEIGGLTSLPKIAPDGAGARNTLLALLSSIPCASDDGSVMQSHASLFAEQVGSWLVCENGLHLHLAMANGHVCSMHAERIEELLSTLDDLEPALDGVEARLGMVLEPTGLIGTKPNLEAVQVDWIDTTGTLVHSLVLGVDYIGLDVASLMDRACQLPAALQYCPVILEASLTVAQLDLATADALDRGDILFVNAKGAVRLAAGERLVYGLYDCTSGVAMVEQGEGRSMGEGQGQGGFTVPVTMKLPQRTFSADQLANLQPGSTLPLGPMTEGMPVELSVGGRPIACGELVQMGDQFAVLIEERADLAVSGSPEAPLEEGA